jgi:peptidoglycan/xylan/chitin deacetylase (PgdA/CDA1 family)
MRPKRDPVPRARDAWVWLGGTALLGILGGGLVAAAMALWENIDVRQLTPALVVRTGPLPEPEPPRLPAMDGATFSAVLFDSPRNHAFFPDTAYHAIELERWRDLIREVGGVPRDALGSQDLRDMRPDEVLVLAEAPCISPPELAAIRRHIAGGGSVVANWAVGVRDGDCAWRGWGPILELTEAEEVQELPTRAGLFMTVPAGTPLASGIDPGTRIELRPDPSLALRTPAARVYWSDWALNPAPDEGGYGADVAAKATRTQAGGRTAWFGMRAGQAATPMDSVRLRHLIQNGVLWAAGVPSASMAPWPGAARAALVFALDVEDQPGNAVAVASMFELERIPVTFFAVSGLVSGDGQLGVALRAAGEVGTQTVDHAPLAGHTAQDQSVRLRRSWADIEEWIGVGPAGLRPPEEAFDAATLRAWRQAGGTYVLARNESRSASPELHRTSEGTVVLLPRLLKDDYNVVVQDRALRAERVGAAFLEGTRKLHAIGGLAVVAGHTQIMESARRLDAFRLVADTARAQNGWWIARGAEVAQWWLGRADVSLEFAPPLPLPRGATITPSGVSDLLVRGAPIASLADAWVDVVLPIAPAGLVPLVDGRAVDFEATSWGIRVPLGTLEEGEERRISFVVHRDDPAPRGDSP